MARMFQELDFMPADEPFDGPMQMAVDEILLRTVSRPLLRIYRWTAPCVTFGYFQGLSEVNRAFPGIPAVRRWTGGGMVEHGEDLTFSLVIPPGGHPAAAPALFYRRLHGCLASWVLPGPSPDVRLADQGDVRKGSSCFQAPALDDLLSGERKILGGAQRRHAGGILYQGSLRLPSGRYPEARSMALLLGESVGELEMGESVRRSSEELASARYRSLEWNGRV